MSWTPVVWSLFIVHMADTGNKRVVPLVLGPVYRLTLRFERSEHVIRVIFDDVVVNRTSFRPPLLGRAST
jgi:hypothetical protein